jgi:hypothetical protein
VYRLFPREGSTAEDELRLEVVEVYKMIKCKICNAEYNTYKQLSWHVKYHNLTNQQYYDMYMKQPNEGYCLMCRKVTAFISLNLGYRQHCNKQCTKLDKQVQVKRLNTNIDRYGYATSLSSKETQDKIKQTFIRKYGVSNPYAAESVKEKIKQNNLEQYGVENPQQRDDVKQKTATTNLELYGNTCVMQSESVKSKVRQTMQERYGSDNIFGSEYGKQKIKETNLERYGVENPQQNHDIHVKTLKHYKYNSLNFDSSWELAVYIYCIDHNISIIRESVRFKYINSNGVESYYFPDFEIEGHIVEIKGGQFLDKNNKLKDKAKQKCIDEHNVELWIKSDVQKYIQYCEEKFGSTKWYNQFR